MYEKAGKFFADWRDRQGHRLRKSFTSARAALKFEAEQKELAHPKQPGRGRQSPRYSVPDTTRAAKPAPRPQLVRRSLQQRVTSKPAR